MSINTTSAPSFASACACASPWPRAPPVTSATFPSRALDPFDADLVVATNGKCAASHTMCHFATHGRSRLSLSSQLGKGRKVCHTVIRLTTGPFLSVSASQ